ncbi:MAG: glycosyltransferase family 2 protein [Gammaproteobacteria bacterium]|nr:glycosyltransferase family 2 protein [Gammaproteobacteria bacterium]
MNQKTDETAAVIVTYFPDCSLLLSNLKALRNQVRAVVIVDNTPDLIDLSFCDTYAVVLPQRKNIGIAAAQNVGIRWAQQQEVDSVLLLDQDSHPSPTLVKELRSALLNLEAIGRPVAAVGSVFMDNDKGSASYFAQISGVGIKRAYCREESTTISASYLIASGSYYKLRTFEAIGVFDETLFIDYVDTEWCFRAAAQGFEIYGACNARLQHRLGNKTISVWIGRTFQVPVHSPIRYYYMARNLIQLTRKGYVPNTWKIIEIVRLFGVTTFVILGSNLRVKILRMAFYGFWDGLKGRGGECLR